MIPSRRLSTSGGFSEGRSVGLRSEAFGASGACSENGRESAASSDLASKTMVGGLAAGY
jgi:hypothetical protein